MNNFGLIQAPYGRFYAGMTLKEAKANGTDKSFWRRDFRNLDKNKDGILSVDEIMKERKRESNLEKITAGLFAAFGLFDFIKSKPGAWKYFWIGVDAFIAGTSISRAHRIDKENRKIEQQLAMSGRKTYTKHVVNA